MLFHRWETISHIISDTKLPWFTKTADENMNGKFEFAEEESASKKYEMFYPIYPELFIYMREY